MNTQTEEQFSLDQVAEILLVKDIRTIKDYLEKGLIPRIELNSDSLTIGAQELAEALKVTNFSEKFIDAKDAQKMLSFVNPLNETICLKKGIPFFYLGKSSQKGRKLLFKESLLRAWLEKSKVTLCVDIHWIENLQKERLFSKLIPILKILSKSTGFGGRWTRLIAEKYFEGATLQEIINETGLPSSSIQQVLAKMSTRMIHTTERLCQWVSHLDEEDYGLVIDPQGLLSELKSYKEENVRLRAELFQARNFIREKGLGLNFDPDLKFKEDPNLLIPIKNLDLGNRIYGALKAAEIKTLGEILQFSANDYLKFRNLGKRSVTELEEFLREKGYELLKN